MRSWACVAANKGKRTKIHVKNIISMVSRGPKRKVGEESNTMDSIRVVEFDPRVLREPGQNGDRFCKSVVCEPQTSEAVGIKFSPVIPTKWVDVNGGGAKQLEYCSRLCVKELKRLSSNVECATFDMMPRSVVSATSDVASELPTDEQVVCQDLLGELTCSLSGMRTEVCNWLKKLQEGCSMTTHYCCRPCTNTNLEVVVESVSCTDLYTIIS